MNIVFLISFNLNEHMFCIEAKIFCVRKVPFNYHIHTYYKNVSIQKNRTKVYCTSNLWPIGADSELKINIHKIKPISILRTSKKDAQIYVQTFIFFHNNVFQQKDKLRQQHSCRKYAKLLCFT